MFISTCNLSTSACVRLSHEIIVPVPSHADNSAGNASEIAQLLLDTAGLAAFEEHIHGRQNSRQEGAVVMRLVQAIQQVKLPSMVQDAAFAAAIGNGLVRQQKADQADPLRPDGYFDEESLALLIAAAQKLNQSTAAFTGLSQVSTCLTSEICTL